MHFALCSTSSGRGKTVSLSWISQLVKQPINEHLLTTVVTFFVFLLFCVSFLLFFVAVDRLIQDGHWSQAQKNSMFRIDGIYIEHTVSSIHELITSASGMKDEYSEILCYISGRQNPSIVYLILHNTDKTRKIALTTNMSFEKKNHMKTLQRCKHSSILISTDR